MSEKIKLGIAGCAGKMGRLLVQEILSSSMFSLIAGSVRESSPFIGHDIGELAGKTPLGIKATSNTQDLFIKSDCIIDFSHFNALHQHLDYAEAYAKPMVIAVTGITELHKKRMQELSKKVPLLYAANTSLGINVLLTLVEKAAKALTSEFDLDIVEAHHRHKKDAPSGTSLALGRALRNGRQNETLTDFYEMPASGGRPTSAIAYSAIRAGGYPGDHSVIFSSHNEVIELKHRSFNRQIYAQGALQAAKWLVDRSPGLYTMQDVLEL